MSLHCEEKVLAEKKEEGRERHPCGELADGYSQSKYVAETLVTRANHSFNLPCVVSFFLSFMFYYFYLFSFLVSCYYIFSFIFMKIYRPGWIGFSFSNGASNPLDLLVTIIILFYYYSHLFIIINDRHGWLVWVCLWRQGQ